MNEPAEPRHKLCEIAQKAVIDRDGMVLILFFSNGRFDLPGGRVDEGESDPVEALKREVREETSLEIDVGAPIHTWFGRKRDVFQVAYRCKYRSGEVQLSHEHADFRWVDQSSFAAFDDGRAIFQSLRRYFDDNSS